MSKFTMVLHGGAAMNRRSLPFLYRSLGTLGTRSYRSPVSIDRERRERCPSMAEMLDCATRAGAAIFVAIVAMLPR